MLLLSPRFFVRSVRDAHAGSPGTDYVDRRRVVSGDELAVALPQEAAGWPTPEA